MNNRVNKGNKDIPKTFISHGGKYFQKKGCFPCLVSFLRVDSVEYDFGLVGFSGNLSKSPPRKLNSRSNRRWLEK